MLLMVKASIGLGSVPIVALSYKAILNTAEFLLHVIVKFNMPRNVI